MMTPTQSARPTTPKSLRSIPSATKRSTFLPIWSISPVGRRPRAPTSRSQPSSGRKVSGQSGSDSRINRARLVNLRARFVLRPDRTPKPWPWRTTLLLLPAVLKISAGSRRPAEHRDGSADIDRVIERNRKLVGHSHTTVRRRITGQITGVQAVRSVEPHEERHRRGNKLAAARHVHVNV